MLIEQSPYCFQHLLSDTVGLLKRKTKDPVFYKPIFNLLPFVQFSTILIIDDDPNIVGFRTNMLTDHNYEVVSADSGDDGLQVAWD